MGANPLLLAVLFIVLCEVLSSADERVAPSTNKTNHESTDTSSQFTTPQASYEGTTASNLTLSALGSHEDKSPSSPTTNPQDSQKSTTPSSPAVSPPANHTDSAALSPTTNPQDSQKCTPSSPTTNPQDSQKSTTPSSPTTNPQDSQKSTTPSSPAVSPPANHTGSAALSPTTNPQDSQKSTTPSSPTTDPQDSQKSTTPSSPADSPPANHTGSAASSPTTNPRDSQKSTTPSSPAVSPPANYTGSAASSPTTNPQTSQKSTTPQTEPVRVLIGEGDGLSYYDLSKPKHRPPQLLNEKDGEFYSVDFHWKKGLVFYSANNKIYRGNVYKDDRYKILNSRVIVDDGAEGSVRLAVDWLEDKLYWMSDYTKKIQVADLDGSNRVLVRNQTNFLYPNNIAVDPYKRLLFYVSEFVIYKMNLANNRVTKLELEGYQAGSEGRGVRCMALDRHNARIYVSGKEHPSEDTNVTEAFVNRMEYDGTGTEAVLGDVSSWKDIYGLDVHGNQLFFAHYNNEDACDSLYTQELNIMEDGDFPTPVKRFVPKYCESGIWSIRVFHPSVQESKERPP